MNLNEFVEKFLPDYENRFREHIDKYFTVSLETIKKDRDWLSEVKDVFNVRYFPEAHDNYTDRIREKQRKNCYNVVLRQFKTGREMLYCWGFSCIGICKKRKKCQLVVNFKRDNPSLLDKLVWHYTKKALENCKYFVEWKS